MEIFPAIDLMSGEAVRLTKGEFTSKKVYSSDPVEVMLSFKAQGARHLHVVDLDGARTGGNQNFDVVKDLCAAGAPDIEIGGGIRDMRRAEKYLSLGVKRIILGTAAVEDEAFLNEAVGEWGDKVAVGVDVLNGFVRTRGWESVSRLDGFAFVNNARRRDSGFGRRKLFNGSKGAPFLRRLRRDSRESRLRKTVYGIRSGKIGRRI